VYAFVTGGYFDKDTDYSFYKNMILNARYKIAADSGMRVFKKLEIVPDFLIGDMDSVEIDDMKWAEENGCVIYLYKMDKDYLDTELAAFLARMIGCDSLMICGVWGGRPDQSIASLNFINLCEENDVTAEIINERYRMGKISSPKRREFITKKGNVWSFTSLSGTCRGINYKGLEYPLINAELASYEAKGLSNVACDDKIEVEISEGELFYFELYS